MKGSDHVSILLRGNRVEDYDERILERHDERDAMNLERRGKL